mmetsp:Transcript_38657/g.106480  ORF Transcript_38657/g.106480 Transcript_38657/m.106480 type:complete len:204 (-) Transcript_38657:1436-2047(-)
MVELLCRHRKKRQLSRQRSQAADCHPDRPQARLAIPDVSFSRVHLLCHVLADVVHEDPMGQKIHPIAHLAVGENIVAQSKGLLEDACVAQFPYHQRGRLTEGTEQGMVSQMRGVHLRVHLHQDWLRKQRQHFDVMLRHALAVLHELVLQMAPHPCRQPWGDLSAADVPLEDQQLLNILAVHAAQLRHRVCDGADKGRKRHQAK